MKIYGNLIVILFITICLGVLVGAGRAVKENPRYIIQQHEAILENFIETGLPNTERPGGSRVYFTTDISSRGMLAVYQALGVPVSGRVAVKVHFGEPGNVNFVRGEMFRDLTEAVNGTFVESNIIIPAGRRGSTAAHLQVARDHGFGFAPLDILDSGGELRLPVRNGRQLTEALMGANIMNYDWVISIANFKGHSLSGFGGTFKNLAVGIATPAGKRDLHGSTGGNLFVTRGDVFHEKVVEYNVALIDAKPDRMIYINILNNLSIDCDCIARAGGPVMPDIGILASLDPVAIEKASLDLIYARPANERRAMVERIETRNGIHQIRYAESMGLGSQFYELIRL